MNVHNGRNKDVFKNTEKLSVLLNYTSMIKNFCQGHPVDFISLFDHILVYIWWSFDKFAQTEYPRDKAFNINDIMHQLRFFQNTVMIYETSWYDFLINTIVFTEKVR